MAKKVILWGTFLTLTCLCIVWLGSLVLSASQDESLRRGAAGARAERAAAADGSIRIGAIGDWNDALYKALLRGISLAFDEVNSGGGILGRQIDLVMKNDQQSVVEARKVAQELADDLDVVAVIGHGASSISISTSVIYEYYGVLMFSPLSTSPKLTRQGYRRVFRNIPSEENIGEQMANFAREQGYRRVVIYYYQDDYGRGLANAFENKAQDLGVSVVDRLSYDNSYRDSDFRRDLSLWGGNFTFDAIFVAGVVPQGAYFIKAARAMGIEEPIFCGEGMGTRQLMEIAGSAAEGTVVATTFDPTSLRPQVKHFNAAYLARFGNSPDLIAAQGYDAAKLLAYAIQQAGSSVPDQVAQALRNVNGWQGVTGPHWFADNGDVINKPMVTKVVKDGEFHFAAPDAGENGK
jgi:branched-chain amino acid transport system substrate-binding protein